MNFKKLAGLALIMILAAASQAAAHPPTNIRLSWDGAGHILHVEADHRVNNRTKHFVMSMTVSGPAGQLASERYDSQSTDAKFSDAIELEGVAPGDKITVELVCNIMGSATQEITIN